MNSSRHLKNKKQLQEEFAALGDRFRAVSECLDKRAPVSRSSAADDLHCLFVDACQYQCMGKLNSSQIF